MIRAIRRRFIRIALAVLALAMAVVTMVINAANWVNVYAELSQTMTYLSEDVSMERRGPRSRHMLNTLAESRYYTVIVSADGECAVQDTPRMQNADAEVLLDAAERALARGQEQGFVSEYLYRIQSARDDSRLIVLLDCETRLTAVRRLALISLLACAGSVLLAWLLVARFSSRAIKPLVENAVRQKQFITDAGHELKTPLTVISANMDVLSLEVGENEWVTSTRRQVSTLRGLVGEMIELSRLDEDDARLKHADLDLSETVREAAEPFVGMAEFGGKRLALDVPDGLRAVGDAAALSRLVSVLCDNAVKYAPEGDEIRLSLRREGRMLRLVVENGLEKPMEPEALKRLFDRFYRADASRSRATGGYGLGLSIARAIAERHGGDIRAEQSGGRIRFICTLRAR